MLPWITDRLPTAEDADPDGCVVYTHEGGLFLLIPWQNLVIPRTPWLPYSTPLSLDAKSTQYGYICWRSTPTGKEGCGSALVSNPAQVVAELNRDFPHIDHWWIPSNIPDREMQP